MGFALYYLILALVVALAATKGGRFEREMALVMVVASLSSILLQLVYGTLVPIVPFTCIDALVLVVFVRILRRYRRLWVVIACVVQVASVAFDFTYAFRADIARSTYLNALNMLFYITNISIACGIVLRRIGPPMPLPADNSSIEAPVISVIKTRIS